jgi:hypothetical protein
MPKDPIPQFIAPMQPTLAKEPFDYLFDLLLNAGQDFTSKLVLEQRDRLPQIISAVDVEGFGPIENNLFSEGNTPFLQIGLFPDASSVTDLKLVQIPERNEWLVALGFVLLSLIVFRSRFSATE